MVSIQEELKHMVYGIYFLLVVSAYCLGSVTFAVLICRYYGLPDPRTQGSLNPGATNVERIGGKKLAIFTLILDAMKGFAPVMIAHIFFPEQWWLISFVMLAVFLGHLYPVFFDFRGGKGVATAFGCLLGLSVGLSVTVLIAWMIVVLSFNKSSLGALVAAILMPFASLIFLEQHYLYVLCLMSCLLIWRHRTNIERMWQGGE